MAKARSKWTPRTIRGLVERAETGKIEGSFGPLGPDQGALFVSRDANDVLEALAWSAREIEALRKKLSWMFVMNRRKKGGP